MRDDSKSVLLPIRSACQLAKSAGRITSGCFMVCTVSDGCDVGRYTPGVAVSRNRAAAQDISGRRGRECASFSNLPPGYATCGISFVATAAVADECDLMRMRKAAPAPESTRPETRSDLHQWVRERLQLPAPQEQSLLDAIDGVFLTHERLWQQSKQEAIQAVSAGFAERMNRMREELSARDATVSSIARYFEDLVADLTDRVHRDPKTRLMNFRRFIEQLEAFLALEQRGRWCAVGLVDITSFKSYNDTLGHAVGDKIIDRVAKLLHEQIRGDDLLAQESLDQRGSQELH